nr:hypothetical protein Q903MT_gene5140 [Picea sitchensis]
MVSLDASLPLLLLFQLWMEGRNRYETRFLNPLRMRFMPPYHSIWGLGSGFSFFFFSETTWPIFSAYTQWNSLLPFYPSYLLPFEFFFYLLT